MRTNYRAMNDTIVERNDMAIYIERIRVALGGYKDSDLADLATTLKVRNNALESEAERLRAQVATLTTKVEQGFAMFEFAVRLNNYSQPKKRLAHGEERTYWQGTTDACRKLTNVYRGEGMFTELFQEIANTSQDAPLCAG